MERDWIILMGAPGVGKSTVAQVIEKYGYFYYEADDDLLPEVKELNRNNLGLTPELRDLQHEYIFRHIQELTKKHKKLVIAYDFMWDRYRRKLMTQCPDLRWFLLTVDREILIKRVVRPGHLISPEFALKIADLFEVPSFPVTLVDNGRPVEHAVKHILMDNP